MANQAKKVYKSRLVKGVRAVDGLISSWAEERVHSVEHDR